MTQLFGKQKMKLPKQERIEDTQTIKEDAETARRNVLRSLANQPTTIGFGIAKALQQRGLKKRLGE